MRPYIYTPKIVFLLFSICCLFLIGTLAVLAQKKITPEEWQPLFNGKNLEGWDIKIAGHELNDNYKNTFRFEDGMVRISYDEYQQFDDKYGHMYYQKPFSYYKLRFQYRFTGDQIPGGATWNVRNSGIMFHSQSAASLTKNQDFPVSLEVQLLGGLGTGPRTTGNVCTPGTMVQMGGKINPDHCINSNSKTYEGDRWVSVEAVVLGDLVVHHIVEGDTVLSYQKPQIGEVYWAQGKKDAYSDSWKDKNGMLLKEGYIALQAESHPIDFRQVEILNLKGCTDPAAKNYKSYYLASDNCNCEYSLWEKLKRLFK